MFCYAIFSLHLSHNGMSHGIENIPKNPHACRCHRCNGWADRFWKRYCFYVNVAFHHMVTYIAAMLSYRMAWRGMLFMIYLLYHFSHLCQRQFNDRHTQHITTERKKNIEKKSTWTRQRTSRV